MRVWIPWILVTFVIGLATGAKAFSVDTVQPTGPAEMSREALDTYLRASFVQILDRSFREAGVFDGLRGPDRVNLLLVAPNCIPSTEAVQALRRLGPLGAETVLVSAVEEEEWITESYPEFPIADPEVADLIRDMIPVRVGPTLIEVRFRTVVGFRLGLARVLEGLEAG
jgi:hypothetical protein